jgi:hypothetical protein
MTRKTMINQQANHRMLQTYGVLKGLYSPKKIRR